MILKIKAFLVFIIATYTSLNAQNFELGVQAGYGSFDMSELQNLQNGIVDEIQIDGLRNTEKFPSYFNFGALINYSLSDNNWVKFQIRYESTGARATYSDYSGSFFNDQLVNQTALILGYKYVKSSSKIKPIIDLSAGIGFANVSIQQTLELNGVIEQDEISFNEQTFFVEPGIGLRLEFGLVAMEPFLNYSLNVFQTGLSLSNNDEAKLMNGDDEVNTQWSGYRTGVNLLFKF